MLADDYRERALQKMMDGVLEVRWEDLIKRDPPQPECMKLNKSKRELTKDDENAIQEYEREIKRLKKERQKYRLILRSDYVKCSIKVKEEIDKFNSRLDEFFIVRIRI